MFDKMKAMMDMQKKMQEMKRQLETAIFDVESRDGLVKITMNGSQDIKAVAIKGDIKEDSHASLEEAVKDALNKAIKRSHDVAAEKMKAITGLNLPGLM